MKPKSLRVDYKEKWEKIEFKVDYIIQKKTHNLKKFSSNNMESGIICTSWYSGHQTIDKNDETMRTNKNGKVRENKEDNKQFFLGFRVEMREKEEEEKWKYYI